MDYKQAAASALRRFESPIPYMYLDTKGLVTVAIGDMLPTLYAARKIPFQHPTENRPSTQAEIDADYLRVSKMKKGMLAKAYKTASSPYLTTDTMNQNLLVNMGEFESDLMVRLDWSSYPDSVKAGLLVMVYCVGPGGLLKFKKMLQALREKNYRLAASYCEIAPNNKSYDERNAWTASMIRSSN